MNHASFYFSKYERNGISTRIHTHRTLGKAIQICLTTQCIVDIPTKDISLSIPNCAYVDVQESLQTQNKYTCIIRDHKNNDF